MASPRPTLECPVSRKAIPRGEDEPGGTVFTVLPDLLRLQHAEGFRREVGAVDVGRVEDVTKLVARQAIEASVCGVEFGSKLGAMLLVPTKR